MKRPVVWSSLILIIAQTITLLFAGREKVFIEENQISLPQVGLQFPILYFFGGVLGLTIVLLVIPLQRFQLIFRILFTFLYSWAIFIVLSLILPIYISIPLAVIIGLFWLFIPFVWLHNMLLVLAIISVGLVFGFLLSPWVSMVLLMVVAVYDLLAVRFGYMVWMAKKLSNLDVLPAFILPAKLNQWNLNLKSAGFQKLFNETGEKDFSLLGGGDIGFPSLMTVSVYFVFGLQAAVIIGVFSLAGLIMAYWIQDVFLKGKPMPAMPPIAFACFVALLIIEFVI